MKKLILIQLILLSSLFLNCSKDEDESEGFKSKVTLTVERGNVNITTYDYEKGIKKYPDYDWWHIDFIADDGSVYSPFEFFIKIKGNVKEGDILKKEDEVVVEYGEYDINYFYNNFSLTVDKWSESNVILILSGKLQYFSTQIQAEGKIETKIDYNDPPVYIQGYDNYNSDGNIAFTFPASGKVTLIGTLNSIYGYAQYFYLITFNESGNYRYSYEYCNVYGHKTYLYDASDNLISLIDSGYTDTISAPLTRKVKIMQGDHWYVDDSMAGYKMNVAKQ